MKQTLTIFLVTILLAACGSFNEKHEKKQISVSIWPQKYFVEKLVGDEYAVNVMVPESSIPAVYEPMPQQIEALEQSVLYFAIGDLGFEKAWMDKLQAGNPEMLLVNTSEGIRKIEDTSGVGHGHHGTDPHYWMSPGACFQMAINMKAALASINPANATLYEKNLSLLQEELARLDFRIRDDLAGLKNRKFLIYHPALAYYARDYDLIQVPIELHGKEPSLSYIKEIVDMATRDSLRNVFIQRQSDTKSAETVARELGGRVIMFDPLAYQWDTGIIDLTEKLLKNDSGADE